jgi:hypothetical protein
MPSHRGLVARRQERASDVSQRIDVISPRGPECDALRRYPRFALFYMAALYETRAHACDVSLKFAKHPHARSATGGYVGIRLLHRWSARATPTTQFWCKSIQPSGRSRHAQLRKFSTGLMKFPSIHPLAKELRMIALLRQVVDPGSGEGARWAQMRAPRIKSEMLVQFGASSKLNAEWEFVSMLRAEGRRATSEFLDSSGNDLGKRSTANLDVLLAEC